MEHPQDYLTEGRPLQAHQWERLRQECSERREGPGEGETTFMFRAADLNDRYDRTIVADRSRNTFRCLPQPHCVCRRGALECQCQETSCTTCGQDLTAMTAVCDFEFCVNDHCPLCEHQRESCLYREVRDTIREGAERDRRQLRACIALAHVGAVGRALAPGVGDSPLFPCTIRILDELLDGDHDLQEAIRTRGAGLEWPCTDGSVVRHNPNNPGWLTWSEPHPRSTPT